MTNNHINKIDHIILCTPIIDQGIEHIKQLTGVTAEIGGRHLTKGTHNAVMHIGNQTYLEILAPDPQNKDIRPPRWMGIDSIQFPCLTRWAIKSEDIHRQANILNEFDKRYGRIEGGSRKLENNSILKWNLTDPLTEPVIDIVPFLLDWSDSVHPSSKLTQSCRLLSIDLFHNHPDKITQLLHQLELDITVAFSEIPKISISLETPKGKVIL